MGEPPPKPGSSRASIYCPIESTWKIKKIDFDDLLADMMSSIENRPKRLPSYPHIKYYLEFCIQSNGNDDERDSISDVDEENANRDVVVFLKFLDVEGESIHTKFSLSIKSANFMISFDQHEHPYSNEAHKICSAAEFFNLRRRFFVNNELCIEMKGMVTIGVSASSKALACKNGYLVKYLWDRDDRDFTIHVGGRTVMIHKLILASRSPVFDAMLRSGMKESLENCVHITDFDYEIVNAAVTFFYDRNITSFLNLINAFELIRFADKYDIKDLKSNVESFLATKISYSNVCQLVNGSINSNSTVLKQICFDFLVLCLRQATPVEDFDLLDKTFAMDLLKHALT